jgi:cation transport ATPase
MIPTAVTGNIVPSMAALAMALSSLSVVINSSRKL